MLLQLTLWLLAQRTASRAKSSTLAALAGCAAGAATLMRPSWLLFTPLVALFAWLVSKPRAQQLRLAACTLLGLAVTMSPWWWRNTRAMGHFVPTSLQVGASWFDAWSPTATGASNLQPAEARAAELRAEGFPPGVNAEYEIDRRLRQEAWQWARQHPVRAFQLAAIKFARMWNIWPNEPAFQSVAIGSAIAISYAFVLLTSLAGTWQFRRLGWPVALLWTPAVYLSAIHMIFVGSIRYREPAMLPLMVLGAAWLVSRYQSSPTANHPISQSVGVQE